MKFIRAEGKIKCIRTSVDKNGNVRESEVAEFDDAIETVAPHVAASLHNGEITQLYSWLQEHITLNRKLAEQPLEKTVLETVPALLDEAIIALEEIATLDIDLHQELKEKLTLFETKLSTFDPLVSEHTPELNAIEDKEILKNQLSKINKEL